MGGGDKLTIFGVNFGAVNMRPEAIIEAGQMQVSMLLLPAWFETYQYSVPAQCGYLAVTSRAPLYMSHVHVPYCSCWHGTMSEQHQSLSETLPGAAFHSPTTN